ncbi:family 20 glycosylhydrolase [Prevotella sp.]|uniref:family 20 glycosylhydrolase n=1 Tax=Prevotella sp. TaxID=59823 RepID=UPI002F95D40C
MKYLHHLSAYLWLPVLLLWLSACSVGRRQAPLALTWTVDPLTLDSAAKRHSLVLKNVSTSPITADWHIYYSQMPKDIGRILTPEVTLEAVNANFFRLRPTSAFRSLRPGDSLVVAFELGGSASSVSQMPEGAYYVKTVGDREEAPLPVDLRIVKPIATADKLNRAARIIYHNNARLTADSLLAPTDILPSVKQIEPAREKGMLPWPTEVELIYPEALAGEAAIVGQWLGKSCAITVRKGASCKVIMALSENTLPTAHPERYTLQVEKQGFRLVGATPHGVFNGAMTLLAMLRRPMKAEALAWQTITDYPDLAYRGFMLDVARNFTRPEDVKQLIDILAQYKVNKLHFHLTDDEGWRIEIPGIEELTAVGSRRGHTHDEAHCLYPCYDGHYDPTATTSGNGFYSRQTFIDLLRYAAQRHVQIIPEIEAPGHARAAIVAMKARYRKYMATDKAKAEEYLLTDRADTSRYRSAQSYTDNVINVALPSTYRFMEKVVTELGKMYKDAGLALTDIHLGGDEVPKGAWMGSPQCLELMKRQGYTGQHHLFEHFYRQMAATVARQGMRLSGWQEIGLHNTAATDQSLRPHVGGIYCWDTVPQWGGDTVPYSVANNGYGVVLCNVANFYADLMYAPLFDERGLSWAGTVNEAKSFAALPFSIYRSVRADLSENPLDIDSVSRGKVALRPEAAANIKGVQAQLFSETIRSFSDVTAYMLPKILGLVERGWNVHPQWEQLRGTAEEQAFYADLSRFYAKIALRELPWMDRLHINFHLPAPGLVITDGLLQANTPLQGAIIRYTTDGSDPTDKSPRWTHPVACKASTVKARLFYLGRQSAVTTIKNP